MTDFIVKTKLKWEPLPDGSYEHESDIPYHNPSDYTTLPNDWPYDFEKGIVHVLVWTKTPVGSHYLSFLPFRQWTG